MPNTSLGRFKALSNADVRRGACAVWRCRDRATTKVSGYAVCSFHDDLFDRLGSVDNPCVAAECRNVATKVPSGFGVMLCNSHEHQRYVLGYTGEWRGAGEPELCPISAKMQRQLARRDTEPLDRFMLDVQGDVDTGCWNWTGSTHADGYGLFWPERRDRQRAHRWAWAYIAGLVLVPGLDIDHICRNILCVRPGHLQQVTPTDNSRMIASRKLPAPEGFVVVPPREHRSVQEMLIGKHYGLPTDHGQHPPTINELY